MGGCLINHTLCAIVLACIVIVIQIVHVCFQEFVLHRERVSVTNFSLENNLLTFRLNAPVVITQGESGRSVNKRCYLYYTHALLRIHVIGSQKSVRIAPPSLPSDHSSPATSPLSQLKHCSMGIIWMCRTFTSSSCPLPWSSTVVAEHVWENHHPIHWEETTVLDHNRGQEMLVKEVLHIQMIPADERLNQDGGLEVPGCCTMMRRQGGRSNPH